MKNPHTNKEKYLVLARSRIALVSAWEKTGLNAEMFLTGIKTAKRLGMDVRTDDLINDFLTARDLDRWMVLTEALGSDSPTEAWEASHPGPCPFCGGKSRSDSSFEKVVDLLTEARDVLGETVSDLRKENERLKAQLAVEIEKRTGGAS